MTNVTPLRPDPTAKLPGYDGLTWSPRYDKPTRRWHVVGCIPGRDAPSYRLVVTLVRAGGSSEDIAIQVAELLDDGRHLLIPDEGATS